MWCDSDSDVMWLWCDSDSDIDNDSNIDSDVIVMW